MEFLSNGDFLFPFDWIAYWVKHFFIWSFQSGALNPDGIIRLPGRLGYVLVFMLFGNVAFSYVYIFSTLLVAFGSFWYFCRTVLGLERKAICVVASLFFAINPVFLGNLSKTGLVLAVAILPLCMALIYKFVKQERLVPLILLMLVINIGLLHPFNFAVNLLVLIIFFLCLARGHSQFLGQNLKKIGLIVGLGIALNAYFLVPLASVGTLDKSALADTIQSEATDYTKLVDIANTGDLVTGFGLAKNVLKDYEFYNDVYRPLYFIGVCGLYILIFGLYLYVAKKYSFFHKRWFMVSLAAFLMLLLLAAVNFFYIDVLIKGLINLPAGWIFRSPLKWQLYIPLFLGIMLALALYYVKFNHSQRRLLIGGLVGVFVFLNGFMFADVYNRLLVPQKVTTFAPLLDGRLKDKTMLYVAGGNCSDYARDNPKTLTELNQVLVSENVQTKRVAQRDFQFVNAAAYAYVLSCKDAAPASTVTQVLGFQEDAQFADKSFVLYKNTANAPYTSASSAVAVLDNQANIAGKYNFINQHFNQAWPITSRDQPRFGPAVDVQDIFDNLSPTHFSAQTLQNSTTPIFPDNQKLLIKNGDGLFYRQSPGNIAISTVPAADMTALSPGQSYQEIAVTKTEQLQLSYTDPVYSYQNILPNPSFEAGLWQEEVGDCYAYDNQPVLGMELDKAQKTEGQQSLQLWALRHNACTGSPPMAVEPGQYYLLSFDYRSSDNASSGFSLSFTGATPSSNSDRLKNTPGEWGKFAQVFKAPEGAEHVELRFYAFPNRDANLKRSANYDNISLIKIPDIQSRFFLVSGDQPSSQIPQVDVTHIDPTKKEITIQGARQPFYLNTTESYHPQWQIHTGLGILPLMAKSNEEQHHMQLNGTMNGWFIDPAKWCQQQGAICQKQADGSYNLKLTMEFLPQRWFYAGLGVSIICLIILLGYAFIVRRREA